MMNKTLQKNRTFDLVRLIETIKRKIIKHDDAFSSFLTALYIDYNFEEAAEKIESVRKQAQEDCLIAPLCDRLIENCHYLYYKVYCKVFDRVDLKKIANSLGKSVDEAELWALKLIRSLDIEAKIDSVSQVLISAREKENINEKYVDALPKMSAFINNLNQAKQV